MSATPDIAAAPLEPLAPAAPLAPLAPLAPAAPLEPEAQFEAAAYAGDLPTLAALWASHPDRIPPDTLDYLAVQGGSLETVQWLFEEQGCEPHAGLATDCPNPDVLAYLVDAGVPITAWAVGQILARRDLPYIVRAFPMLAERGWQVEFGEWAQALFRPGKPAADLLGVVQYLHSLGWEMARVPYYAAKHGHRVVLEWLVAAGVIPWAPGRMAWLRRVGQTNRRPTIVAWINATAATAEA